MPSKSEIAFGKEVELTYGQQPHLPFLNDEEIIVPTRGPTNKGPFPLRVWKRAFFVSFIDLSALKIEASAKQSKKINKTNKE